MTKIFKPFYLLYSFKHSSEKRDMNYNVQQYLSLGRWYLKNHSPSSSALNWGFTHKILIKWAPLRFHKLLMALLGLKMQLCQNFLALWSSGTWQHMPAVLGSAAEMRSAPSPLGASAQTPQTGHSGRLAGIQVGCWDVTSGSVMSLVLILTYSWQNA